MSEKECILDIPVEHLENIFGQFDANIKLIEQTLSVTFIARDDRLKVIGEEDKIKSAADIMQRLYALSKKGETITKQEVNYLLGLTEQKLPTKAVEDLADDCICHTTSGKPIKPKTIGQKAYVDAIRDQMITFGIGPAGTGNGNGDHGLSAGRSQPYHPDTTGDRSRRETWLFAGGYAEQGRSLSASFV